MQQTVSLVKKLEETLLKNYLVTVRQQEHFYPLTKVDL